MWDEAFNNGEHIAYVNGADKDASAALGRLMYDFYCTEPDDMHYKELADKPEFPLNYMATVTKPQRPAWTR